MKSSAETEPQPPPAEPVLAVLVERLERQVGFAEVIASLAAGHSATLGGVWGSSCALIAASLTRQSTGSLVVVCSHGEDLDNFIADLSLFSDVAAEQFPAWESNPRERKVYDEIYGNRLRLLKQLQAEGATVSGGPSRESGTSPQTRFPLIVTSIQSLLQPVPRRETLLRQTRRLKLNEECEATQLAAWLLENGFHSTSAVEFPGEFSLRGGIFDVFAADWVDPVRIEFFGDTVESIRAFEVSTQRSLQALQQIEITALAPSDDDREHFCNYLPGNTRFLLIEPGDLEEEGRHYLDRLDKPQEFHSVSTTNREITRFPSVTASGITAGSLETTCHLQIESVERFSGDIGKVRDELDSLMVDVDEVHIVCQTEAESQRLHELFASTRLATTGKLHFPLGHLKAGFRLVAERVVLVSGGELFHREDLTRPTRIRRMGRVLDSFSGTSRRRLCCPSDSRHRPLPRAASARKRRPDRRTFGHRVSRRNKDLCAGQ